MIHRLADKKMNMLWHHNVTQNLEAVAAASQFQRIKKDIFGIWSWKVSLPAITTEGDKVVIAFLLTTLEAQRHA